jgi:hypothetical protein
MRGASPEINQFQLYYLFFLCVPVFTAFSVLSGMVIEKMVGMSHHQSLKIFISALLFILPIAIMIYGLVGIRRALYHFEYTTILDVAGFQFSRMRFILGCVVTLIGFALIFFAYLSKGRINKLFNNKSILKIFIFATVSIFFISILRPDIGHDSLSYDPYIGPASAVALGANPFTEVFSQYGFNYLILTGALKILPWSMFSVSLIISLVDAIYLLLVLIVCIRISENTLLGTLAGMFLIVFYISSFLYNPSYTPSVMGMRYLPPLLLLNALFSIKKFKVFNIYTVTSLLISAVWSLEALIFTSAVFLFYIFISQIQRARFNIGDLLKEIIITLACIAFPHLILTIGCYLIYGVFPRYDIYLELISTTQKASSGWIVAADPLIRTWIIPSLAYAITFSFVIFYSWAGKYSGGEVDKRITLLGCTSVLGIAQLSYYAGRAATPVLLFISFPLIIIFIYFVDSVFNAFKERKITNFGFNRLEYKNTTYLILIVLIFIVSGGVIFDRLYRPISPLRSNSILLRECLTFERGGVNCVNQMFKSIREKLRYPSGFILPGGVEGTFEGQELWQVIPNGMAGTNIGAYLLVKKWIPYQDKAYIFITNSASVFFSLKKQNALGLSCPMVEDRSPILRGTALSNIEHIKEGQLIFVGDLSRQPIEEEIMNYLKLHWSLVKVDELYGVVAYRLQKLSS